MKELIKTLLADITRKITSDFKDEISVEIPENKEHGDYSVNVAFGLSKILKKSPFKIADNIAEELLKEKSNDFYKIEARNGFINFFLSPECLRHQLQEILSKKNKYGESLVKGQISHVNIEFISANPTGPLTIGNGRGGFYGDVLANILETQGHKVTREFYINDRGGQILALGQSIKLAQKGSPTSEDLEVGLPNKENLYHGDYINDLAKQIDKNFSIEEAGQKAVELILKKYIKPAIKRLDITFDNWFSEKSLYASGSYEKVMGNLMQGDFLYEKDGATFMKTSGLGDSEDRVLIKSDGSETYFLSDILYHYDKFITRKFEKVIDIWGADHHGYAPRLKAAVAALGIPKENLDIIITQLIRLISDGKEAKVSKRAGTFITLEELVNEVGLDATRFFFLMYSNDTHMDFDMDLAKERSAKNPVYYVQYAYARLCSILRKSQISNPKSETNLKSQLPNLKLLKTEAELNLIRKLIEFPEILVDISKNYEVHRLPRYALELSREFHNFYEKERVITENKNLTSSRLALVMATKIVLANILNLMRIKAPDRM
ncbi:MAG: arginine--tRNA ligase [Patescibacteria group bacterium]